MSTENDIPRDNDGHVIRPRPSQLLMDVMEALGPDHPTTKTLIAALAERDAQAGIDPHATTPGGLTFPVLSDAPNVPYDMQQLALSVDAKKVAKTGDTMTGDLTISKTTPLLLLKAAAVGQRAVRGVAADGGIRWNLILGDGTAENGTGAGSYFQLNAYTDGGVSNGAALTGDRTNALLTVKADPTAALGIATKQYVDKLGMTGQRVESASVVGTTNASGNISFAFTAAFASVPVVTAVPGDSLGIDPAKSWFVGHPSTTTTTFSMGGFAPNTAIRINYVAIGARTVATARPGDEDDEAAPKATDDEADRR